MPIKVQCSCGKAFAAKDELAGKTVKCPGCQQPLKIPGEAAPAKAAVKATNGQPSSGAAKPAASKAAPASKPASKPAATKTAAAKPAPGKQPVNQPAAQPAPAAADDLFADLGLAPPVEGTRPCPGCTEPLAIEAVVCVKCGYNTRLGRRMTTAKSGGGGGGGEVGHGAVAQDLLDRAAAVIDEDAAEEVKKTSAGTPWWVYLIVLIALVGFGAAMLTMRGGDEEKDKEGKKTGRLNRGTPVFASSRGAGVSPARILPLFRC
jgi:hypothetical protein